MVRTRKRVLRTIELLSKEDDVVVLDANGRNKFTCGGEDGEAFSFYGDVHCSGRLSMQFTTYAFRTQFGL